MTERLPLPADWKRGGPSNGVTVRAFVLDKAAFDVGLDDNQFTDPLTHCLNENP